MSITEQVLLFLLVFVFYCWVHNEKTRAAKERESQAKGEIDLSKEVFSEELRVYRRNYLEQVEN